MAQLAVHALIASIYLIDTNTGRVRRALKALVPQGGALGDEATEAWRTIVNDLGTTACALTSRIMV
jgi:hypothetical protein